MEKLKNMFTRVFSHRSPPAPASILVREPLPQSTPIGREEILRQFETWMEETLAEEQPPRGFDPEILSGNKIPSSENSGEPDLYSLWSAMVALTQEVKLQGRTFKQLQETIQPVGSLTETLESLIGTHEEFTTAAKKVLEDDLALRTERERRQIQAAQEQTRLEFLDGLLDLRDRLLLGRSIAQQHLSPTSSRKPWWNRFFPAPRVDISHLIQTVKALEKGYTLTVDRLEDILRPFGIEEIECLGNLFDPRSMKAVDVVETSGDSEGTVLEVYRRGYQRHDQVLRTAEVKVARKIGSNGKESEHE
jgi:molecular chaperone GrpE